MNNIVVKRAITICWIMLILCFIAKLFGGNWFGIICTNEHFIQICDFIDNNLIIRTLFTVGLYLFSSVFLMFAITQIIKPNKTQFFIIIIGLILVYLSKYISMNFKTAIEILYTIVLPFVLRLFNNDKISLVCKLKESWYLGIIGYFLVATFQILSFVTRNIGIVYVHESSLTSFILLIDYYIMIFLFYFYLKLKKGDN